MRFVSRRTLPDPSVFSILNAQKIIAGDWRGFENLKLFSDQNKMYVISIQNPEKVLFWLRIQQIGP